MEKSKIKQEPGSKNHRWFFPVSCFLFLCSPVSAAPLSFVSDTVGTSAPSLPATHEIKFTATNAVLPGGKIIIAPRETGVIIPSELNFLDADLSVATSSTYTDRPLSAVPDTGSDGFSSTPGTAGNVVFTLNSTFGINAGEKIQIKIGNNATFAATGTNFMINPTPVGSYRVDITTEDASGDRIDFATAMIAIIEQVTGGPANTTITNPPLLSNGLPAGLLPSGTAAVELSVQTDLPATCKYSTLPDIPFASSTGAFLFTGGTVHSGAVITGLTDGSSYNYYVRCRNYQLLANSEDYDISFSIGIVPSTTPPEPSPPPPPVVASIGIPGGGDFLKTADVIISGKSYPFAKVFILKDGKETEGNTVASDNGTWETKLTRMERGTYTFGMYSLDSKNKRSATISSTISVIAGTTNAVTRIFFPPTLVAEKTSVESGGVFVLSGQSIPKSVVEASLQKQNDASGNEPRIATTTVGVNGLWSVSFGTKGLSVGGYEVRVRSIFGSDSSGFSAPVSLGLGQDAAPDLAARSDMNNDGKVNLIDFSILLFSWGTGNATADINANGKVDLADFSILIFYWTG